MLGIKAIRSIQYDTVSDLYPRFLRDEALPEIYSKYNTCMDACSHAIAGNSSGGSARLMPPGTCRTVEAGQQDGRNIYPFRVRKEEKRNIRVCIQDGSEDQESPSGSWPLQNIQMAKPEVLTWLWRDYDPAKTQQTFEMDQAEKAKPVFRVKIYNRD